MRRCGAPCRVVIVGDASPLERGHAPRWPTRESGSATRTDAPVMVESVTRLKAAESRPGRPARTGREASYRYILRAVELIRAGATDAMATAPISKKALNDAGHAWPGHTELLAERLAFTPDHADWPGLIDEACELLHVLN